MFPQSYGMIFTEGYLRLRFGGLIFGRAFFLGGGVGGGLIIGILRYSRHVCVGFTKLLIFYLSRHTLSLQVKRPGRWDDNPDRAILDMAGVTTNHSQR